MMVNLDIKYEGYRLYSHGSIIVYDKTSLEFNISELAIEIRFDDNNESPKSEIKSKISNDRKKLTLILTNFNNNIGVGSNKPLPIGNMGGYEIYLLFVVKKLADTKVRVLNYTWLLKDKVDNIEK